MGKIDTKIWALLPIAVAINVTMGWACSFLPVYLDSLGTILVGVLAGPWAGALAGGVSNLVASLQSPIWLRYFPVAVLIGVVSGWMSGLGIMRRGYLAAFGGLSLGVLTACASAPITAWCGGASGGGTDLAVAAFRSLGFSSLQACFAGALCVDPLDKLASVLLVQLAIVALPSPLLLSFPLGNQLVDSRSWGGSCWQGGGKKGSAHGRRTEIGMGTAPSDRPENGHSWFHQVSPGTKLTLVVCCGICIYFVPAYGQVLQGNSQCLIPHWYPLPYYPLLLAVLFAVAVSAGVGAAMGRLLMVSAVPLGTIIILFNGLWGSEGLTPLIGSLVWSIGGAFYGYERACNIALIVESLGLLFLTTPWSVLVEFLERLGLSAKLGYVLAASLNFIPSLQRQIGQIRQAQAARALPQGTKLRARLRYLAAVAVPLLLSAVSEASERAVALEMRGFGATKKRTVWKQVQCPRYDSDLQILIILAFLYLTWCCWQLKKGAPQGAFPW